MDKIPAIFEKYDDSYRITPECPFPKTKKSKTNNCKKIKAELVHWEETDAMDIFIRPQKRTSFATTKVVKRFEWDGSITKSIYGKYRINMPSQDKHGNILTIKQITTYASEAQKWIQEDMKNLHSK